MVSGYNQGVYSPNRVADRRVIPDATKPTDAFSQARVVSLYQYVDDVLIGTGRDQNGEIYEMRIPIAIDLFYSPEFGGVNAKYTMADWKSTDKEIVYRGWHYQGKQISRATKDGRDFAAYVEDCMRTIEIAVNEHFSPVAPEVQTLTKVVAPLWAWLTLFSTVILVVLLALSMRPV